MLLLFISLFIAISTASQHNFKAVCSRDSERGLEILNSAIDAILGEGFERRERLKDQVHLLFIQNKERRIRLDGERMDTCPPYTCPTPEPTIFPPPFTLPPTTPSKPPSTTPQLDTGATDVGGQSSTTGQSAGSTTTTPSTDGGSSTTGQAEEEPKQKPKLPTTFFTGDPEMDPFHVYMNGLKKYLNADSGACDQDADFQNLNSITWEQLFGFFSQLATVHPGPFCNLCERFADAVEKKVLRPNPIVLSREEVLMRKLFNAYLPSPRLLCSSIAPGCTDRLVLEKNASEITEATRCLECTFCYSGLNALFHQIFLDPKQMDSIYKWFHDHFFLNLCADLCVWAQESQGQLFGSCFTAESCQKWTHNIYDDLIKAIMIILKPERFCVLELGWCDLGEQPNIMHCLRELCEAELGTTAPFGFICSLIPDRPPDADAFLNIQETKIYKPMKDYHYEYYASFDQGKDEL